MDDLASLHGQLDGVAARRVFHIKKTASAAIASPINAAEDGSGTEAGTIPTPPKMSLSPLFENGVAIPVDVSIKSTAPPPKNP